MIDFDKIKEKGFLKAFFLTWRKSLFSPEIFFGEITSSDNVLHPYFYAVIFGYINLVFSFFWEIFFFKIGFYSNYSFLPKIPLLFAHKDTITLFIIFGILILLIFFGILYSLFLLLLGAILHGFILLFGGKKHFRYTFRIICYTAGVNIFSIMPIFGYNIILSWFFALTAIGIKKTDDISTAKSIIIVLLPYIFISLIMITFIIKIITARG
jgi:hypothetical protein